MCRDKYRVKELHPQYLGVGDDKNRGTNWQSRKRATLNRDKRTCQICGKPGNDVHHVVPKRKFNDKNESNGLDNLITLCKRCHRIEDAKVQKEERLENGTHSG